jgi:Rad17 P-loop domain
VVPALEAQTAEWVQKHRPQGLKDVAVAKKKVQEAQQWLEAFKDGRPHPAHPRMLLLTGGSGSRPDADGECACSIPARPTLRLQRLLRCH